MRRHSCHGRRLRLCGAVLACGVVCGGCQNPQGPVSVRSDDPELKIPAIRRAVDAGDETDAPQLVRDLDDSDPAVRFYASQGLRRLTGYDYGYCYYQPAGRRAPAVARWRAWLAGQHRADPAGV